MRIDHLLISAALLGYAAPAMADESHDHALIFHAFRLEVDGGGNGGSLDLDGWIGGDYDKLWLKAEGELDGSHLEEGSLWAMYSRNVAEFWDLQVGIAQDVRPGKKAALVAGINGLAPYFFETEAHILVRSDGKLELKTRFERDLLFTNRLILQPYAEALALSARDVSERRGRGLVEASLGTQLRYELRKDFAPYVNLDWTRSFAGTARLARAAGDKPDAVTLRVGLRTIF